MNIIEKMKKEVRMIFAIVNFISFFLPWVAVSATSSTSFWERYFRVQIQRLSLDLGLWSIP